MDRAVVLSKALKRKKEQEEQRKENPKEDSETLKLRAALQTAVLIERPDVRWENIAGLHQAKRTLKQTVMLPRIFPSLFTGKRAPWRAILLYGPVGLLALCSCMLIF